MNRFNVDTTGEDVVKALGCHAASKTILVTGPSHGGIGAEIAETLASANPSQLLLLGRNKDKVLPVMKEIQQANPAVKVDFVQCDLSDNASVRRAAEKVNSTVDRVDVLINNAGVMAVRTFQKSVDGVESQFAAGYLGHFLLTNLIMDKLVAAKGVVINMTSSAYTLDEVDTEDPNFTDGSTYNTWNAYARTKTADVLFTFGIAKKLHSKGVDSFAVDPGMVAGTNLMSNTGVDATLMKEGMQMAVARNGGKELPPHPKVSLRQGCASAVLASLDHSLRERAPAYIKECAIISTLPYASDYTIADKLWALSEKLVGQKFNL